MGLARASQQSDIPVSRLAWPLWSRAALSASLLIGLGVGCDSHAVGLDIGDPLDRYRDMMLASSARPALQEETPRTPASGETVAKPVDSQADLPDRAALLTEFSATSQPSPNEVLSQIPDPIDAERIFAERLSAIENTAREARVVTNYRRVIDKAREYLSQLRHKEQSRLSLAECIQRALQNNYTIRAEAFQPAINRTYVVEAEAAFDAVFFLDSTYANNDNATASDLSSSQSDQRNLRGGFRKLLPTGMRAETSVGLSRTFTDLQFATINPSYSSTFNASLTQPLLRGFGLDYNRTPIELRKADLRISYAQFEQRVRDQLFEVERAYWQLSQARRVVMILAESVSQNFVTYENVYERRRHDATPIEINNSRSRWQQRVVEYLEAIRAVRDAEDRLKNLLNDPDFTLATEIEIIPTETPLISAIALDQLAEAGAALKNRSEILQARERIEQSRIGTARAKNETLPTLDLSFNYEVQGLERSADVSFDRLTSNRFRSYSVSATFSVPIGERASKAALRRARLQESAAIVQLNQVTDQIVEQVNDVIRLLGVRLTQVPPQYDAVIAADLNLRAFQERTQTVNPNFLETELSAVEQIANTRRTLVQVVIDYTTAVVELERVKGTLLRYNNVQISDAPTPRK